MNQNIIKDDFFGELENSSDSDDWQSKWRFNESFVDIIICSETDIKSDLETAKAFLESFSTQESQLRKGISENLLKLCNEDWNVEKPLTEKEFAERISLQGINMDIDSERIVKAEVFYNDDDIFGGHAISFFMKSNGEISEPNLAG
jgi:hypothetical protein